MSEPKIHYNFFYCECECFFTPSRADIDLILTHVSQIVFHHKLDSSVKKITFYKRNTINY